MKKIIAILAAVLMLTAALAACGNDEKATPDSATKDSAAVTEAVMEAETTRVLETTAEGNTVEEDAEGNVLEISKDGELVSVKDKNGSAIEVTEYITTHYIVTSSGTVIGSEKSGSGSGNTSSSSKANSSSSKSESGSSKPESSSSKASSQAASSKPASSSAEEKPETPSSEEEVEDEIPTVVIEMPDTDEYELPIL